MDNTSSLNATTLHIGMVAGEPSGDLIASHIIQGIPHAQFMGIGGTRMQAQGMEIAYPMDALSVFGYVDALKQLPRLIRTYYGLKSRLLKDRPQVFVGVDAPDFNLRLEKHLKANGIPTVHLVGPSIWAWRYERIHHIRDCVDHMLVLFPFEVDIYKKEGVPVTYVGHPLASQIPFETNKFEARVRLGLPLDKQVLAILPGSRASEIKLLAPVFLETAQRLSQQYPDLHFVLPLVNPARLAQFKQIARSYNVPNMHIIEHKVLATHPASWDVLEACDATLVASGTATLEAALFKKPMVISYIISPLMRKLMAWKSGQEKPLVPWVGLPNVLLQEFAVPELIQEEANPTQLANACDKALHDTAYVQTITAKFDHLHHVLAQDTARLAAQQIVSVAHSV